MIKLIENVTNKAKLKYVYIKNSYQRLQKLQG